MPQNPSFRELLSGLGFGEIHQPRCLLFIYDVTQFLKSQATNNVPNAPSHEYSQLATSFLMVHERGFIYWPPIPRHSHFNYAVFDDQRRINDIVACLFRRIHEMCSRNIYTSSKGLPFDAKKRPLPRSYIFEQMARSDSLGFISFTYGISQARGSAMFHNPWFPQRGFDVKTFGELVQEVPGAAHALGFDVTFTGPNFRIEARVVNDNDLNRLKLELNRQLDYIVIERAGEILQETLNLHLQLFILTDPMEQTCWIF